MKYNQPNYGDIILIQTCKPMKGSSTEYVLETEIIDTGIGIQPDRQNLLFIPFLELRDRIGIVKAENDNIGLGLSCSREISRKLGGDMKLKLSKKGMTSFVFKFPVVLKDDED